MKKIYKLRLWIWLILFGILSSANASLLKNSGFEELNADGSFPALWAKHWLNKGEFVVINDVDKAHSGMIALSIKNSPTPDNPITSIGSQRVKVGEKRTFTMSFWAKGTGRIGVNVLHYGNTNYLTNHDKDFQIWFDVKNPDNYEQFSMTFTIPETGISPADNVVLKIDEIDFLINVQNGPIIIDDIDLNYEGEKTIDANSVFKPNLNPFITLTKVTNKPLMDGKISDKTWLETAATTGMRDLTGKVAREQAVFFAGFDEENLYFAFEAKQKSLLLGAGPTGRNIVLSSSMEAIEIWIKAPNMDAPIQFIGVPSGGMAAMQPNSTQLSNWGDDVQYSSFILESTEMMGGILTLGSKTWTGEIVIPFKSLGTSMPKDGEIWRINFCRDFSVDGGAPRNREDWSCWAPINNTFASVGEYGYAKFDSKSLPFQMREFGDLSSGNLSLNGRGDNGFVLANQIFMNNGKNVIVNLVNKIEDTGTFKIADAIKTNTKGITPMEWRVACQNQDGELVGENNLFFSLMPTFWIKPRILYSQGNMLVDIDASRSSLPANSVAAIAICSAVNDEILAQVEQDIDPKNPKFSLKMNFDKIPAGTYKLKGYAKDSQGNEIASTVENLVIPEKPHWLGNKIGYSTEVPPPFTPVTIDGNKVGVVLREYTLGNNGFPMQIKARDLDLLNGAIELKATVNGEQVNFKFDQLKLIEHNKELAKFEVNGSSKLLNVKGTLQVEYDGFAIWDVDFVPIKEITIDNLQIQVPMKKEYALFGRGDGFVAASLLQDKYTQVPGREDVIKLGNMDTEWGSWEYSRKGWIWENKFFNEVYMGDDRVGFSLLNEGSANIKGPIYATMKSQGKTELMTVNLISKPTKIDNKYSYTYCYQAMPLKPEPKDPRIWHNSYDPGSLYNYSLPGYSTKEAQEHLKRIYVGQAYYDLIPDGYPRLANGMSEEAKKGMDYYHKLGIKVVHNLWYGAIADYLPEYKTFGAEWDALPKFGWSTPNSHLTSACLVSGFQDFHIWCTKGIIDDLKFDGVYTDATPIYCQNELHGCGYIDENGERRSTLNFLATRNFVKRMYVCLKADGKNRLNFSHSGEGGSTGAFNDVRTHGEEICWEDTNYYKRITPDYFRTKYAQTEYGVPYSFFPVFYYSWRAIGKPTPISEALMMSLAHRVGVTVAHLQLEMNPVWDFFDPWWTSSDFKVYWRDNAPATTNDLNVTASTFLKAAEGKAIIVLSNWNYNDTDAVITLDINKLGFTPSKFELIDVISGKKEKINGNNLKAKLKARNFKVLSIEK